MKTVSTRKRVLRHPGETVSKKVTIVRCEGWLATVEGGRKESARTGRRIDVLHNGQTKLAWWKPGTHWWSLPMWRAFQRTENGVIVRPPCVLDVLA